MIQIEVSGDGRTLVVRKLVGYIREPSGDATALYEVDGPSEVAGLPIMLPVRPGAEAPVWKRVPLEEVAAWLEDR